jgi:two-component system phosphate regulon sensor histidine kinase PhoR
MRREFVANVSHELKTPLAAIKAYAETLRLGAIHDRDKNLQFVEQIESQAELLNQQIHSLLQLARVESGQQLWNIETVAINEVCQECVHRFQSEAESRGVTLSFNPHPQPPNAVADRDGVRTILDNLISNALHYTPRDGRVTVATERDGRFVVVTVTDTGIGIAPEHQSRIFERFYRVDRARSRDRGGTGLGLAIVKHLVQAFAGRIEVQSQVGQGSCFTFHLPTPQTNLQ